MVVIKLPMLHKLAHKIPENWYWFIAFMNQYQSAHPAFHCLFYLFVFVVCFGIIEVWTQSLELARQVLCHLTHIFSPFCFIFSITLPRQPLDHDPPMFAFQVAGNISVRQLTWASACFNEEQTLEAKWMILQKNYWSVTLLNSLERQRTIPSVCHKRVTIHQFTRCYTASKDWLLKLWV
jgi:hypothetical protein